jgi:hypothetical protein
VQERRGTPGSLSNQTGGAAPPRFARRDWLGLLAILLVTAAVYWRGLDGGLVYDDKLLIASNPWISSLANLPRLLASGYWDFLDIRASQYIGYWRPLTSVLQALIWPIAGSSPNAYHAVSLAAHLGAVTAAFLIASAPRGSRA